MTPSEKRIFKTSFTQEGTVIAGLFDFLNRAKHYDEDALKAQRPAYANNLKVYKQQLYNNLLRSLTVSRDKNRIQAKIRQALSEVEVLMEKRLYLEAYNRLKKVKAIVQTYELFTYLIEIGGLEYQLLQGAELDALGGSKNALLRDNLRYLEKLQTQLQLLKTSSEVLDFRRNRLDRSRIAPKDQTFLIRLEKEMQALEEDPTMSLRAEISRLSILSQIYATQGNRAESGAMRLRTIRLFEDHPSMKDLIPQTYVGVLRNGLNYLISERNFYAAERIIFEAEAFIEYYPDCTHHRIFFRYGWLDILRRCGRLKEKILEAERQLKEDLELDANNSRIGIISRLLLASSFFMLHKYRKAQDYLRQLRNLKEDNKVPFLPLLVQLMELTNHVETEDWELVKRHAEQFRLFAEKHYSVTDTEVFTDFLQLLESARGGIDINLAGALAENIVKRKEDWLAYQIRFMGLYSWLRSKVASADYYSTYQEDIKEWDYI